MLEMMKSSFPNDFHFLKESINKAINFLILITFLMDLKDL